MELSGKVLDEKTQEPIANRKIIVHELRDRDDKTNSDYLGEFRTDSLGRFVYRLKKSKVTYFYNFEFLGDSMYAFSKNHLGLAELDQYGKFLTFRFSRLTDLTLKIERRKNTAFLDTLFVSWQTNGIDGEELYPYRIINYKLPSDLPLRWVGGDIRSVVKTKVFADKPTIVHWELYRHGRPTEFTDTIFCRREETNNLHFKY